jgi:MerR family transcriptional regulator/heat shock protein HspR
MRYVRLEEAVRLAGVRHELLEALLDVELIRPRHTLEQESVISQEEANELRVARTLLEELGVNVAGVEIILHMRRRQIDLQRQMDELVHALKDELRERLRDRDVFGPRGFLPG